MPDREAFLRQLELQYGTQMALELAAEMAAPRPVTLRVNTRRMDPAQFAGRLRSEGIRYEQPAFSGAAFILPSVREDAVRALPEYEQGVIYLQSLSSMLPPLVLAPQPGEDILDMCAAPGGKTAQIDALTGGKANLTACEKSAVRCDRLRFNLNRQGVGRVSIMQRDARTLEPFFRFDRILLDAPCSGSGTLGGENDRQWQAFSMRLVQNSARLQRELLKKAVSLLKPGHCMVYSTCSILREENEDTVAAVLRDAQIMPIHLEGIEEIPALPVSLPGTLCVRPGSLYEGFFMALLRKNA